ncbi:Lar family restriction alleviation protein [Staphylococcus epidermidis]|uniref:Lar family restriction alleviation protein n=1 Tax=Staphylococcus epidermidis TaxID=1282 RepID=UPI0019D147F5|nr:Lar family restriction alleviation protein [Staphylococcus epidermidis]MBN6836287.1 Lar family restriction alleviation protein [Staphylococcus epidermidis]MCG2046908.1 Lar family restriction alleviation protein [Staphylococcus epidermidis]
MSIQGIKPCPFCGGRADLRYSINRALIECANSKCKIQPSTWLRVDTDSVDKLVKIWNTRKYKEEQ